MAAALVPPIVPGDDRLLLRGATLIDGTGGPPLPDAELEIADGRIVYAGPRRADDEQRPPA
ncbi:amidohydrolase family protein, partial [Burkholderia multivorans]